MHSIPNRVEKSTLVPQSVALQVWAALLILAGSASADDWRCFRGPNHNGVSAETGWMVQRPGTGPKVAWRTDVGIGASSVVVAGGRLVTMGSCKEKNEEIVWCLDAHDGSTLWQFKYASPFDARQFEGGPASTPTIDGRFVYALGYLGHAHCLNLEDGRVEWRKHLVDDFGGRHSSWKYAGSPLVTEGLVIFDTGADGNSTLALDKTTGRKVWSAGTDLAGKQAQRWDGFVDDLERVAIAAEQDDAGALLDVVIRRVGLESSALALDSGRSRADRSAQSDDLVGARRLQ